MSQGHPYHANEAAFPSLRSRVVVLTGGASGIGRATVERLHSLGARVVFADLPTSSGAALASRLSTPDAPVTFVPCDVGVYADNVLLFKTAWELYGKVEHAVACAGVLERGRWFDVGETREGVEREPDEGVVRVNLVGSAWFLRIAGVYLRDRGGEGEGKGDGGMGRSVTLLSSAAGFRRSPGLPMYQVSFLCLGGWSESGRGRALMWCVGEQARRARPAAVSRGADARERRAAQHHQPGHDGDGHDDQHCRLVSRRRADGQHRGRHCEDDSRVDG